ncbi:MAG: ABC transporter ATP-binding protein [Thermomicrobiales bacterium]
MIASAPTVSTAFSATSLRVHHLGKRYGETRALDDVSLEVARGELVTVLGPSGCGKTTLLRAIAGFVMPDAGEIAIDGVTMTGVPPYRRPTAMVFQSYALFPHLTVAENVAFGLQERPRPERLPKAVIAERVEAALALVELGGFGGRRIAQLSGGQQQRVALARSLVLEPTVLLLDEPLGALDVLLRRQMQGMLKHLQRQTGITFLAVTHDQEEALTMSDRIVVMHGGRIAQQGTPREVFMRPRSRFVAEFLGDGRRNLLPMTRPPDGRTLVAGVAVDRGVLPVGEGDGAAWAMLPPSRLRLVPLGAPIPAAACQWEARIADVTFRGATISTETTAPDGTRAIADLDADVAAEAMRTGDLAVAWFDPADLTVIADPDPEGISTP